MNLFDQADDVPHPQDTRRHALGVKWLQGLGLLPDSDENNGLAGDLADRQRRATPGIAVSLGQDHAGQVEGGAEGAGRIDRVLPGHGIDHKESLHSGNRGIDLTNLFHQFGVDVQAARRIDDEDVVHPPFRLIESGTRDVGRSILSAGGEKIRPHLFRKTLQLQDRCRPPDVRADQQDTLAFALNQPARQLGRSGGLSRTLKACQQHDDRRLRSQIDAGTRPAHEFDQLTVQDADKGLAGRQAGGHLGAERLGFDRLDEGTDDWERHIRFQQGDPHFPQRLTDILLGNAAATPQVIEGARQSGSQVIEHGLRLDRRRSGGL